MRCLVPLVVRLRDRKVRLRFVGNKAEDLPSPKTASISSRGTPIVSGYTAKKVSSRMGDKGESALQKYTITKLQAQKNPCMGYNLHAMSFCSKGVTSPTRKLKAQFVAVS